MGPALHALLHPIRTLWQNYSATSWQRLPSPRGEPVAHAAGPDADRILLLGSGIAVGYGVLSHDLSLAGHLARRLSALTGRGVFVNIMADPDLGLRDVGRHLDGANVGRFDAVVLTFGGAEAATLASPRAWRKSLESALGHLDAMAGVGLHVFVAGIPTLAATRGPFGEIARRRAALLNVQSALVCADLAATTYVPLDGTDARADELSRSTYNAWAGQIAESAANILTAAALDLPEPSAPDEIGRQRAVDRMTTPTAVMDAGVTAILDSARDLFGVSTAAVNIIDGPTQRVRLASGARLESLPREESLCDAVIHGADGLVVEDALLDPRFRDRSQVEPESGIRFYAGYPLEAPGGERVGALCIIDDRPRRFSETDLTLLRELALRAQALLWTHRTIVNPR